jgi:hypothetical protein
MRTAFLALLLLAGCVHPGRVCQGICAGQDVPPGQGVEVQYLGSGGVLFRRGDDVILTAPFYSNPSLWHVNAGPGLSDVTRIDEMLRRLKVDLSQARAILVGHSHYDHLMDVPWIARRAPRAEVYGNDTMRHILASIETRDIHRRAHSLQPFMAAHDGAPGEWRTLIPGRVRVLAIKSDHAGHLGPIDLLNPFGLHPDEEAQPRTALPDTPGGYRRGQPLAFLIDFMEGDRVVFRVHYQDAAARFPSGRPPRELIDQGRAVDLAVVCVGSYLNAGDYPESLLRAVKAGHVLLAHWEWFFDDPRTDAAGVKEIWPASGTEEVFRRAAAAGVPEGRIHLPAPGAWVRYPVR